MNEHILSLAELTKLDAQIHSFRKNVSTYISSVNTVIDQFSRQGVVQSLFESGNFGADKQARLIEISRILNAYWEEISTTLIPQSLQFVQQQKMRVNSKN